MEKMIYDFIHEHMYVHIMLISVSLAAILGAMAVDFVFGIRKAKENGEARTSAGFKKTAVKAQKYFSPFMVLVFIDLIGCVVVPFPAFSMIWAAYCVFCEFKSVREKAWEKAELRRMEKTISVAIANKEDLAKMVASLLFEGKEVNDEKKQGV